MKDLQSKYNHFIKAGVKSLPTSYAEFESSMKDKSGGAQNIYNGLKEEGVELPEFDEFYSVMMPEDPAKPQVQPAAKPQVQPQQASQAVQPTAKPAATPMTEREQKAMIAKAEVLNQGIDNIIENTRVDNLSKVNQPLKTEVHLGTQVNQVGDKYITTTGNEYETPEQAKVEQFMIDESNRQRKREVDMVRARELEDEINKEKENLKKIKSTAIKTSGGFMASVGGYLPYDPTAASESEKKIRDLEQERRKVMMPMISEQLTDVNSRIETLNEEINNLKGGNAEKYSFGPSATTRVDDKVRLKNKELSLAMEERDALELMVNGKDKNFFSGLIYGMTRPSTYTFGLYDLAMSQDMLNAKNAYDKGALTDEQKQFMAAYERANTAKSELDSNADSTFRFGNIAAQSAPFMLEFFGTGGMGGIQAAATSLAKRTAVALTKNMAKGMAKNFTRGLIKNTGIALGDIAAAGTMAVTTGGARTSSDIINRYTGHPVQKGNEFTFKYGTTLADAVYKGLTSSTIEYYTEMLGTHMESVFPWIKSVVGNRMSQFAENVKGTKMGLAMAYGSIGLKKLGELADKSGIKAIYNDSKKAMKLFGLQSYPYEALEEEAGIVLNSMLTGDNKISDLIDGRTQEDIWGGMLYSIGMMQGITGGYSAIKYYGLKHKLSNQDVVCINLFGDQWASIKEQIDSATNDNLLKAIFNIRTKSAEERKALLSYGGVLSQFRGFNTAVFGETEDKADNNTPGNPVTDAVNRGFTDGYNSSDDETARIEKDLNDKKGLLNYDPGMSESEQFQSDVVRLQDNQEDALDYLIERYGEQHISLATDYYNALNIYNGLTQRKADEDDDRLTHLNQQAERNEYKGQEGQSGNVITADMGGNKVYIVRGDVNTETGEMSGAIVVRDEQGKIIVTNGNALTLESVRPLEEIKQENAEIVAAERLAKEQEMKLAVDNQQQQQEEQQIDQQQQPQDQPKDNQEQPQDNQLQQPQDNQEQQQEPAIDEMPMIGEGEEAEPDFYSAAPSRTRAFIYDESGWSEEDANDFVDVNIESANREVKSIEKKKPKASTSFNKYKKELEAWKQELEQAKKKVDYWQQVKTEQSNIIAAKQEERRLRDEAENKKAVEEELQRQQEITNKRKEQERIGANAVHPAIREKWDNSPKIYGAENELVLANGEKVKGRYVLVESGAATPSHNPMNGFTRNEGFPVDENGHTVNDRDYERDKEAQDITRQTASSYDSRALQDVPVVSSDGIVLSGNGRTMAGELAAHDNTDGDYIEYLKKYPEQFGFTKDQVSSMKHPRVLFVTTNEMPYNADTFSKFNAQDKKAQSRTEQSIKLGKTVDDSTFNRIVQLINTFDSIADFYNNAKATTEAISELQKAGVINAMQYAEMFDGENVSGIGRQMLENMLVGKFFQKNPEAIRQLSEIQSLRQNVISALAEISNNRKLGNYSLERELAQAIDLAYQARKHGFKHGDKVSGYARQMNLFPFEMGETVADYTNATILMLANILNDKRTNKLKNTLTLYNRSASDSAIGQMDLFTGSVRTKEEIIKDILKLIDNGTKEEQESAINDAVERRKADSNEQDGAVRKSVEKNDKTSNPLGRTRNRNLSKWFGPIYTQFEGKANEAESHLRATAEGVAKGALVYPGVSPIDLVWGDMKAGYMKIVIKHPEVVGRLQEILSATTITSQSDNRIVFESDTHKMIVSRMKGSQPTDNWLLTAYEKKEKPVSASSSDIETEPEGKRNGTATPQNGASSADKVTNTPDNNQGEEGKVDDYVSLAERKRMDADDAAKADKGKGNAVTGNQSGSNDLEDFLAEAEGIEVVDIQEFPKEIRPEDVVRKTQKGGKRADSITIDVALHGNDLYIRWKSAISRKTNYKRKDIVMMIPDARRYSSGHIRYRIDIGIGVSTDAARLINDAILEIFHQNRLRLHKGGEEVTSVSGAEAALRDVKESRVVGGNSGYVGYSMSKRAAQAREEGRFPKTDFKKIYGLSDRAFDMLVSAGIIDDSEWHHTSKFGNKTTFYSWAEDVYAEIYAANKKEFDAIAKKYNLKNQFDDPNVSYRKLPHEYRIEYRKLDDDRWKERNALREEYKGVEDGPRREEYLEKDRNITEKYDSMEKELEKKYPEYAAYKDNEDNWRNRADEISRDREKMIEEVRSLMNEKERDMYLRDAVIELLQQSGIEVVTNEEEAQRVLDEAQKMLDNGDIREHKLSLSYYPRLAISPVRGKWTKSKIIKRLKDIVGTKKGYSFAARRIAEFDSAEELAEHMFYHGTQLGSGRLKPSILMSDSEVERIGGGGYGQKYWGISVSKSKRIASNFSTGRSVRVYPIILVKNAKIKEMPELSDAADLEDYIEDLWEEGVDAVWIGDKNRGEQELCVINPAAIVNIDNPDMYKSYMLGTSENPINIIDNDGINKLYQDAKRYVNALENKPKKPEKPSRFLPAKDGETIGEMKSDEQYQKEMSEYERKLDEYNNSDEVRRFQQEDEYAYRNIRFFKTPSGHAYGFTVDGKIYVDKKIAGSETPIHEYSHLWAAAMRQVNPEEWKNIVNLMKGTTLWEEVKKMYPELTTDDDIADEVLAHYSGKRGAERLKKAQEEAMKQEGLFDKAAALSAIYRVKEALNRFWRGVADFIGVHFTSAEEVADKVLSDLLNGVNPANVAKNGEVRYQFIGEKGASEIDAAEEATTRLDNLRVAREMENAGKEAKEIKMATGWERGADGKWRYEILDGKFDITGELHPERRRLSEEEHKFLEDNFEETMQAFEKGSLAYDKEITEDTDMADIYEAGGMERKKAERIRSLEDKEKRLEATPKKLDDYLDNEELFTAYPELRDIEIDTSNPNTALLGHLASYDPTNKVIKLNDTSFDTLLHEVQHAIQYIEGFAKGGSNKNIRKRIKDIIDGNKDSEDAAKLKKVIKNKNLYQLYTSIAGEVEARNVQKRLGMPMEQRRELLASETEDVAREDQIILEEGLGLNSSTEEKSNTDNTAKSFHDVIESMFSDDNFDKSLHTRERYDLGATPNWMKRIGITGDRFSLSFKNIKIHQGKDVDHNLTKEEWHQLPDAIKKPFAVTRYKGAYNRFRLYVNIMHNGNFVAVGVDVKRVNQGRNIPMIEVNSIKTVFAHQGEIGGSEKAITYDENITPEQEALLRGLNFREYPSIQELSATKVVKEFKNPSIEEDKNDLKDEILTRAGSETETISEKESGKSPQKPIYTEAQKEGFAKQEKRRVSDAAREMATRLGLEDDVEFIETNEGLTGREATAKGWFNRKTGKIVVVLGNHISQTDVLRTIIHEGVAHYGLRKLLGERFDTFLDEVFKNAEQEVKESILELSKKHGYNIRTATEEYLASLAEKMDFEKAKNSGWWTKIKSMFLDMMRQLGLGTYVGPALTDNELRYLLWRSYENLAEPGRMQNPFAEAKDTSKQLELKVGGYENRSGRVNATSEKEGDLLFRDGDFTERDEAIARDAYENAMRSGRVQFIEEVQDSMRSLVELYKAILGKKTRVEDIEGFENPYMFENRLSSMNMAQQHLFYIDYEKPILKAINKICKGNEKKREELINYMMAKHGLERNLVFARRDAEQKAREEFAKELKAAEKAVNYVPLDMDAVAALEDVKKRMQELEEKLFFENREKDYGGITGLMGIENLKDAEEAARTLVDDYEGEHDLYITDLWNAVNAATQATLEKIYESGIISKESYENIRDMFEYYIPLQGWDETTSDEVYAYLIDRKQMAGAPIKHAKGRRSKADDPIATIGMRGEMAVMQANRNLMKQTFLNFVLDHPSDLVSVSELWLEYDEINDVWMPVFVDIEEGDTADDIQRKTEAFEQQMESLRKSEPDKYKKSSQAQNVPYKVVPGNLKPHQVIVKRNGKSYVLTINGNPKAAMALNGLTNPDVEQKGFNKIMNAATYVNRKLSIAYTTANINFTASNFVRDMVYSNTMAWIKESPWYALNFHWNFSKYNPAMMRRLFGKWENGTLNLNDKTEKLFYDFMKNGGETGFSNVRDIDAQKKFIISELKKENSLSRKAIALLASQLDMLNRSVENTARFAAFATSRGVGRSIERSVYDAKEISVNFNKKGSGGRFLGEKGQTALGNTGSILGGSGRLFYVFWNAGIQGLSNIGKNLGRHKGKIISGLSTFYVLGMILPMLYGDDDDNSYYDIPEKVRRSNICIKVGEQWVTIPLPIEFRAIYGLGELATGVLSKNDVYTDKELAYQIASQISQILPIDFLEGDGGVKNFVPTLLRPYFEAYFNESWTGLPIYKDTPWNQNMPEWTKAYKNTNSQLVDFTKFVSDITGGDEYKKGAIDINPAQVEHVLNGLFGGYVIMGNQLVKMAETAMGERDFDWRNMIIANRVITNGDERVKEKRTTGMYYKIKEEVEENRRLINSYRKDEMDEKADKLETPEYENALEDLKESQKNIKEIKEMIDETSDKDIQKELNKLIRQEEKTFVERHKNIIK